MTDPYDSARAAGGEEESLSILFGAFTDCGRERLFNEDQYLVLIRSHDVPPENRLHESCPFDAIFAVSDGMGGEVNGKAASEAVVKGLRQRMSPREIERVCGLFSVNPAATDMLLRRIIEDLKSQVDATGGGATLTLLAIRGREWFVAFLGDSRAYLSAGGRATPRLLTEDQKAGEKGGLINALGAQFLHFRVALRSGRLNPGDTFILHTDGMNVVNPDYVRSLTERHGPAVAAEMAVREAVRTDGTDNATAVVCQFVSTVAAARGATMILPPLPPKKPRLSRVLLAAGGGALLLAVLGVAAFIWFIAARSPAPPNKEAVYAGWEAQLDITRDENGARPRVRVRAPNPPIASVAFKAEEEERGQIGKKEDEWFVSQPMKWGQELVLILQGSQGEQRLKLRIPDRLATWPDNRMSPALIKALSAQKTSWTEHYATNTVVQIEQTETGAAALPVVKIASLLDAEHDRVIRNGEILQSDVVLTNVFWGSQLTYVITNEFHGASREQTVQLPAPQIAGPSTASTAAPPAPQVASAADNNEISPGSVVTSPKEPIQKIETVQPRDPGLPPSYKLSFDTNVWSVALLENGTKSSLAPGERETKFGLTITLQATPVGGGAATNIVYTIESPNWETWLPPETNAWKAVEHLSPDLTNQYWRAMTQRGLSDRMGGNSVSEATLAQAVRLAMHQNGLDEGNRRKLLDWQNSLIRHYTLPASKEPLEDASVYFRAYTNHVATIVKYRKTLSSGQYEPPPVIELPLGERKEEKEEKINWHQEFYTMGPVSADTGVQDTSTTWIKKVTDKEHKDAWLEFKQRVATPVTPSGNGNVASPAASVAPRPRFSNDKGERLPADEVVKILKSLEPKAVGKKDTPVQTVAELAKWLKSLDEDQINAFRKSVLGKDKDKKSYTLSPEVRMWIVFAALQVAWTDGGVVNISTYVFKSPPAHVRTQRDETNQRNRPRIDLARSVLQSIPPETLGKDKKGRIEEFLKAIPEPEKDDEETWKEKVPGALNKRQRELQRLIEDWSPLK